MLRPRPRALALALLLLVAVLLAGCDDDPAQPAGAAAPVMALDVGNAWDYAVRLNEPGAAVETFRRVVTEHREITVDGNPLTVAVEMPVAPDPSQGMNATGRLLRDEPDGLYSYGRVEADGTLIVARRTLMVPRNLQAGTTYTVAYGELHCVAADSTVTTDFGTVQAAVCEYVRDEGTVRVPDVYVVPGVGLTRYYNPQFTAWVVGYDFE